MLRKLLMVGLCVFAFVTIGKAQAQRVPGHVLIKLKPAAKPAEFIIGFATQTRSGGGVWIEKALSQRQNIHLMKYDTTTVEAQILREELLNNNLIEEISYDFRMEDRSNPNDPGFSDQWGLSAIEVEKVWETTTGGQTANGDKIVVAILDSGFDLFHEDIQDNIWINKAEVPGDGVDNDENGYVDDYYGWNFINNTSEHISDAHGHSVAGIIGAKGDNGTGVAGINWEIELMVLETRNLSEVISAYEYILHQRELYNASNGTEGAFVVATNASFGISKIHCSETPLWGEMYDKLGEQGILTAAATANNYWDVDEEGDLPTTCPSDYLMTVLNTNNFDERYIGSAYGKNSIDMGAPGQNSFTTKPFDQYGVFHGNSAAAPHLAGAIALLYSLPCSSIGNNALKNPAETAKSIRNALMSGVDKVDALKDQTQTGGRLNIYKAMQQLMGSCESEVAVEASSLAITPNPAREQIRMSFDTELNSTEPYYIRVVNSYGKQVYSQELQTGQLSENINIESWQNGIYVAFIEQNGVKVSKKFVIMQ